MPYEIKILEDQPAPVLVTDLSSPFDTVSQGPQLFDEINARLSQVEGDIVYMIVDITRFSMNFGDLVIGLASVFRPQVARSTAYLLDPRVQSIVVGTGDLVNLLANSIKQEQYAGNGRSLWMFKSMGEALAHIKQAQTA